MIEASQIATNRYAPAGSRAINLYSTGTAENLTLGQLVSAVCIRTAGALEEQSVNKMNMIDLQTLINRRDMTYNTSSNVIKAMGNSKSNSASKML
jgi:hypothetical protein